VTLIQPANQGRAKSRWPLVMKPHQGDSAGRGWDDVREQGAQ